MTMVFVVLFALIIFSAYMIGRLHQALKLLNRIGSLLKEVNPDIKLIDKLLELEQEIAPDPFLLRRKKK